MGLFPFCLPASFEWSSSSRLRLSAEERAEENWGNHQFENTLGEIKTVGKRIMKIRNIKRRGYIEYRLYMINDRLWDFYNHFSWRFSENFEVFWYIFAPSALDYLDLFSFAVNQKKRYSDAFLVAISCSFGSHGEKGVFWVEMCLYIGSCGIVLIVGFRLYLSFVSFVSFSIL